GAGGELAGGVELDREAAERAIAGLAGELGLDPVATAEGIVRVADAEMLRALRVVTVERGVDPRRFALLPFGGAGPLHAASIAEQLDVRRILCPRASGVLSALGLAASERRRDTARTLLLSGGELTRGRITQELEALEATISEGFEQAERHAAYELRYHGQSFELAIEAGPGAEPAELRERFEAEHERRYGYRDPDSEVELVNLRLALVLGGTEPEPEAADGSLERGEREVRFGGEWTRAQVLRGEPAEGVEVEGPCVFELPEATLALPVGWRAVVDAHGTIVAERGYSRVSEPGAAD
nr:hydantoinase/oxoprolinase family protein [Solirubrobacterales bacterium]